ncbi:MAG: rhomboid family intramembrane serine protease [Akkermansiaceae bacterium]
MGYDDRDYMKSGGSFHGPGGEISRPSHYTGAPVSKFLMVSNVVIFLVGVLLTKENTPIEDGPFAVWGHFSITEALQNFQLWRVFTFQFLHGSVTHLLFNMIGIFFFGPHVERMMGSRPFSFYYLFCGIAGALFYSILYFVPGLFTGEPPGRGMVGASAGIFGILAAFYKMAPNARILLFFFIPMSVKTAALFFFISEVIHILFGLPNAGGSAGHLGGALLGLSFIKFKPLRIWLIKISRIGVKSSKSPRVQSARVVRERRRSALELTKEVDRILEKISKEGMQSLTRAEKETLENARRKS